MPSELTDINDWIEWKTICSYGGCSSDVRGALGAFVALHFTKRLGKTPLPNAASIFRSNSTMPFPAHAWQWLEVHILQKDDRGGITKKDDQGNIIKSLTCKDWLFENGSDLGTIEGRISQSFLREAAKEFCREQGHPMEDPLETDEEDERSPDDSLTGGTPVDIDIFLEEFHSLVRAAVDVVFPDLHRKTKIALAAKGLEMSLADPKVTGLTGLQRQALYDRFHNACSAVLTEIGANILMEFVGWRTLALEPHDLATLHSAKLLGDLAIKWAKKPVNSCKALFV